MTVEFLVDAIQVALELCLDGLVSHPQLDLSALQVLLRLGDRGEERGHERLLRRLVTEVMWAYPTIRSKRECGLIPH
jgi:hypothetical protein